MQFCLVNIVNLRAFPIMGVELYLFIVGLRHLASALAVAYNTNEVRDCLGYLHTFSIYLLFYVYIFACYTCLIASIIR